MRRIEDLSLRYTSQRKLLKDDFNIAVENGALVVPEQMRIINRLNGGTRAIDLIGTMDAAPESSARAIGFNKEDFQQGFNKLVTTLKENDVDVSVFEAPVPQRSTGAKPPRPKGSA